MLFSFGNKNIPSSSLKVLKAMNYIISISFHHSLLFYNLNEKNPFSFPNRHKKKKEFSPELRDSRNVFTSLWQEQGTIGDYFFYHHFPKHTKKYTIYGF